MTLSVEGVLTDRISQRLEGMQQQNEMDKLAFQSEANNRINSMQPQSFAETYLCCRAISWLWS